MKAPSRADGYLQACARDKEIPTVQFIGHLMEIFIDGQL